MVTNSMYIAKKHRLKYLQVSKTTYYKNDNGQMSKTEEMSICCSLHQARFAGQTCDIDTFNCIILQKKEHVRRNNEKKKSLMKGILLFHWFVESEEKDFMLTVSVNPGQSKGHKTPSGFKIASKAEPQLPQPLNA